jgi:hypothetical protein
MSSNYDNQRPTQIADRVDHDTASPENKTSRRAQRRRVLSLIIGDAARTARRYVTNFRAGRGAE